MQLVHECYHNKVGKTFDLMHWSFLLNDVPKWETMCDEGIEFASKRLRVNDMGVYSNNSSPSTPSTPETPSTPITPGSEDAPNEEGMGYFAQLVKKP